MSITRDKGNKSRPHYKVYTRLGCSSIHGVGVFAIKNIPKGADIFYGDEEQSLVKIKKEEVEKIGDPEIRKLYLDFCIIKDGVYKCPPNFNQMTVGWYLNEPREGEKPNVGCHVKRDYIFYALRNIQEGEELTVDYSTFWRKTEGSITVVYETWCTVKIPIVLTWLFLILGERVFDSIGTRDTS
jgi:hypothetical protein